MTLTDAGLTAVEAMTRHFQLACETQARLRATPRWRRRQRRVLREQLVGHCTAADECRRQLGSNPGPGLLAIIDVIEREVVA